MYGGMNNTKLMLVIVTFGEGKMLPPLTRQPVACRLSFTLFHVG